MHAGTLHSLNAARDCVIQSVSSISHWQSQLLVLLYAGARLLSVRGFLFLVLQELQAPSAISHASSSQAGPSSSQVHIALSSVNIRFIEGFPGLQCWIGSAEATVHTQVSLSQCCSLSAASSGTSLLQELTGFLRRSLSQQAQVREGLYQVKCLSYSLAVVGIPCSLQNAPKLHIPVERDNAACQLEANDITEISMCTPQGMQEVLAADSLVHSTLVELLLPRMCVYYRVDDASPPLALDKCAALQVTCLG